MRKKILFLIVMISIFAILGCTGNYIGNFQNYSQNQSDGEGNKFGDITSVLDCWAYVATLKCDLNCTEYSYSDCPSDCKPITCLPSTCDGFTCTADCGGSKYCLCPDFRDYYLECIRFLNKSLGIR